MSNGGGEEGEGERGEILLAFDVVPSVCQTKRNLPELPFALLSLGLGVHAHVAGRGGVEIETASWFIQNAIASHFAFPLSRPSTVTATA